MPFSGVFVAAFEQIKLHWVIIFQLIQGFERHRNMLVKQLPIISNTGKYGTEKFHNTTFFS